MKRKKPSHLAKFLKELDKFQAKSMKSKIVAGRGGVISNCKCHTKQRCPMHSELY